MWLIKWLISFFVKDDKSKVEIVYINTKLLNLKNDFDNYEGDFKKLSYSNRILLASHKIKCLSNELGLEYTQIWNYLRKGEIPITKSIIRNNKLKKIKR